MIRPLIAATLKSFLRSRRTLVILFLLPLLLISSIFVSFNPDGLRPVPAGVVLESGLAFSEAEELFDMLVLTEHDGKEQCIDRVREHDSYLCIYVYGSEPVTVEISYDNTREPVVWEVINLLEYRVQYIQRQRSAQAAESLFASIGSFDAYLGSVAQSTELGQNQLARYEADVSDMRVDLRVSRVELSASLDTLESDIASSREDLEAARLERERMIDDMNAYLDDTYAYIEAAEDAYPNGSLELTQLRYRLDNLRDEVDAYERESEAEFDAYERTLDLSEQRAREGREAVSDMRASESELSAVEADIRSGRADLSELRTTTLEYERAVADTLETGSQPIVDSVRLVSYPVYIPYAIESGDEAGFDLLSYQTLFPSLLMLVAVFFGLLLSSFMTITYVTTPAYVRLRLVQGAWFSDFVAMFVSSVLIASVSVGLVFSLGFFLFKIPIDGIASFAIILFGILSVLTLMGMAIVHLVWSESMSIIVSMFAIVSLLFSSGFILPIERMSSWAAALSAVNPVTIGLEAFDRMIFYARPPALGDVIVIGTWVLSLAFIVLIVRLVREH